MEAYIFALIAFLLFIPIIYVLPTGFTKFGKFLILGIAFMLALIGILFETILTLWQTILIMILLLTVVGLFIEKKYGKTLFQKKEMSSEHGKKVIKFELEDDIEEIIQFDGKGPSIAKLEEPKVISNKAVAIHEENDKPQVSPKDQIEELQTNNQTEIETPLTTIPTLDTIEELKDQTIEQELIASKYLQDVIVENETFAITETQGDELEKAIAEISATKQVDNDELANSNSILDELIKEVEKDENQIAENLSLKPTKLVAELHSPYIEIDDSVEGEIFTESTEDSNVDENDSTIEIANFTIEEIDTTTTDEDTISLENESSSQEPTISDMIAEEIEEAGPEVNIPVGNSQLKQQVLQIMVSQLKLLRKSLPSAQYEKLIISHLHPDLSDRDCYTFISLLIEHYVLEEKYHKLLTLLMEYRGRFKKYPIILQEINYLLEEYCKK
ncbi:hypothetical protein [Fredinandcohnia sp. 179-A 10B2 NHS]|uniref:hypothetical protein n=1 Tax=Fredinandcohnia sp. 179-A 10B2 NHS TaxID=3235176 RepID=UPI0039A1EA4A